ncbi:MAG TPA: hypothetical protein VI008_02195 [Rubrobacter sp.]|jgi:hypothetical protein
MPEETNPSSLSDDATSGSSESGSRMASSRTPGPERPLHNLPLQLSSFVGRGREAAEVEALLADNRLLTLTGPGGSGKTRLALAVAHEVVQDYEDGAWLLRVPALLLAPSPAYSESKRDSSSSRVISFSMAALLQSAPICQA